MLSRLYCDFGVTGAALNWVQSYLQGRSQRVLVGQSCSNETLLTLGVPQGSVLGPLLFTTYISPVGSLIKSFGICHQQYADDTQLFIAIPPASVTDTIGRLEHCLTSLHCWFGHNGMALNPNKSEAIWFSTPQRSRTLQPPATINFSGTSVPVSDAITTLGVTLDKHLLLNSHVAAVSKSCNYHIRALRHIRSSLTEDMAKSVALALVSSRLDYANSLLYGTSDTNINKLQRIQNSLAKLVLKRPHISSSTALHNLHWLPIKQRIDFKISTFTYKLLHTRTPSYLSNLLLPYTPVRSLRSSDRDLLVQPSVSTVIGSRAFSVAAPTIWNKLPITIRQSSSLTSFRRLLKTHLFTV